MGQGLWCPGPRGWKSLVQRALRAYRANAAGRHAEETPRGIAHFQVNSPALAIRRLQDAEIRAGEALCLSAPRHRSEGQSVAGVPAKLQLAVQLPPRVVLDQLRAAAGGEIVERADRSPPFRRPARSSPSAVA